MIAAISLLIAKVAGAVAWFGLLFVAVFVALWDLLKDGISWALEQVLKVATSAISGIDVSALSGFASSAGTLPASIMNILSLLHVGQAIGIITAAILIRLVLQLIPFVRLGS